MISAVILAAGLSKRMKLGNKLLLEKNNTTIIESTLERVKASKVNEIVVVLGRDSNILKSRINGNNIILIKNQHYRKGIATSIKKGLEKVNKESIGAMICLGDMPWIKTVTYDKIINSFYKNNEKNIVPYFKYKKGNPVLFNKIFFEKLMKINGDEGAKLLIKRYSEYFLKLSVSDEGVLKDIDDEEQYLSFLKNA